MKDARNLMLISNGRCPPSFPMSAVAPPAPPIRADQGGSMDARMPSDDDHQVADTIMELLLQDSPDFPLRPAFVQRPHQQWTLPIGQGPIIPRRLGRVIPRHV